MRIGFANVYSFRPHVEHLYFLSELMRKAGHEVFFLTCDAAVSNCYARAIKGTEKVKECSKCIAGGVRSYTNNNVSRIADKESDLSVDVLDQLALSSSCTLTRVESELEWNEPDVRSVRESLHRPVASTFESAKEWIVNNKLEGVICFNGRMELTRAITYASETLNIPYITHERTWFGDGIQLIPNANCLSLASLNQLVSFYDDKPLTHSQALFAGQLIGERFLQRNSLEWRLYNKHAIKTAWPIKHSGKRVLILPSSKNEFSGHDEWKTSWEDNTMALDDFFDAFGILPNQVVLRCHPNWSENIGKVEGGRSLRLYQKWAESRGIYCINSEDKESTYDLIQQSDIVILNGGSSAVEAGACGKTVVCLGPSTYQNSGFVQVFKSRNEMDSLGLIKQPSEIIRRKTLRFLYVRSHRFPQFVDFVKARETTRYEYFEGADAEKIITMLTTGEVQADDSSYATDDRFESEVVEALVQQDWDGLANYAPSSPDRTQLRITRRLGFRWIDGFRAKFTRGDRG